MRDLTIYFKDNQASLADIGEILGNVEVNIEGLCGFSSNENWIVHILVKDAKAAQNTLLKENIDVTTVREVIVFSKSEKKVVGQPGSFGEICRQLISAGIHIDLAYAAENNKFVFGVDDIDKARDILGLK
jgi:hypothetical protein